MAFEEMILKCNVTGIKALGAGQSLMLTLLLLPLVEAHINDDTMFELASAWFCELCHIQNKVLIDFDIASYVASQFAGLNDAIEDRAEEQRPETWQDRFIAEYTQLVERERKLNNMITDYEHDTLDFKPNCPIVLLRDQLRAMDAYRLALEKRAEIENIDIEAIRNKWGYGEVK